MYNHGFVETYQTQKRSSNITNTTMENQGKNKSPVFTRLPHFTVPLLL